MLINGARLQISAFHCPCCRGVLWLVIDRCAAGWPFIVINTLAGSLTSYGLIGLRYRGYSIALYAVIIVLNALIAIQFLTLCVWLTPNQVITWL